MSGNDIPCRVSADLARHDRSLRDTTQQTFDAHDDDLMHDIVGNDRLAKPVQDLLIALSQIDLTKDSFGLNAELAVKFLVPKIEALRHACIEEGRDL